MMSERICHHPEWKRTYVYSPFPDNRIPLAVILTCTDCLEDHRYHLADDQ